MLKSLKRIKRNIDLLEENVSILAEDKKINGATIGAIKITKCEMDYLQGWNNDDCGLFKELDIYEHILKLPIIIKKIEEENNMIEIAVNGKEYKKLIDRINKVKKYLNKLNIKNDNIEDLNYLTILSFIHTVNSKEKKVLYLLSDLYLGMNFTGDSPIEFFNYFNSILPSVEQKIPDYVFDGIDYQITTLLMDYLWKMKKYGIKYSEIEKIIEIMKENREKKWTLHDVLKIIHEMRNEKSERIQVN